MSYSKWSFRRMKPPKEPRSRQEIKAELEELMPKICEAEGELEELEAKVEDLYHTRRELQKELDPLLRPWERPRPKYEHKILQCLEGVVCKL
ncbi:hypothetical protein [Methanolobus chelungpuianus]|uniref:Uncharacterized protein n=1 Tax=Methanolobus chelungpuianus TaxID=502115 RepID=A0AAE3HAM9_9EURY|nr:hypothetical protein [Methanolobus chelungpuianus]MCQ6962785.1 hypothetical protein [Methanolobus chelungpuianus]